MNRRALVLGTVLVGAAAFAGGAFLFLPPETVPAAAQQETTLVRNHSPVIGPADAPVTIVEFLDPACEACRAFYPIVKQIMETFPQAKLVIRYAPLHNGSDEAVRLLEAARMQGKFLPVLEKLFFEQPAWAIHGAPDLEKMWAFAGDAGLDVAKARTDAQSPGVVKVLNQDVADMKAINLEGTPTFFVNGKPLASFGPQQLHDLVAAEVAIAEGPPS
jgi:protein-disulfide isomerase